jgi:hypothetical protein
MYVGVYVHIDVYTYIMIYMNIYVYVYIYQLNLSEIYDPVFFLCLPILPIHTSEFPHNTAFIRRTKGHRPSNVEPTPNLVTDTLLQLWRSYPLRIGT